MTGNCQFCGTMRRWLHEDHIIPRSLGGVDGPTNWQYLCANCHEDKTFAERQTPEWKAAASARSKSIRWSDEAKKRQGDRQRGKKRVCANKNKGRSLSPDHLAKMRASWTPERREAQRQMMLGKKFGPRDPSVGAKISAALKGRSKSASGREKYSARMKAEWAAKSDSERSEFGRRRSATRWAGTSEEERRAVGAMLLAARMK